MSYLTKIEIEKSSTSPTNLESFFIKYEDKSPPVNTKQIRNYFNKSSLASSNEHNQLKQKHRNKKERKIEKQTISMPTSTKSPSPVTSYTYSVPPSTTSTTPSSILLTSAMTLLSSIDYINHNSLSGKKCN